MWYTALPTLIQTAVFMIAAIVIGRVVFGLQANYAENYSFTEAVVTKDNPAVLVRFAGMIGALLVATFGSYWPTGAGIMADAGSGTVALVGALIALILSRYINDFVILHEVNNNKEVVENRNIAVAVVEFATYLGTALIFIGGMRDPSHGIIYNLSWFVLGQVFLIGLSRLYSWFVPKVFEEIGKGNTACALSLGGFLLSGAMVIGTLISGEANGWFGDTVKLLVCLIVWLAVMFVSKLAIDRVVIPGNRMVKEMVEDKNWGVGLVDCTASIGITTVILMVHIS